jgi:hypothetical protein
LDATDAGTAVDGTEVTTWPDRSGNGNDFARVAAGAVYKDAIQNSNGVLRFTQASAQSYVSAATWGDFCTSGQFQLLIALKVSVASNDAAIYNNPGFCDSGGYIGLHFKDASGLNSVFYNYDGSEDTTGTTDLALGTWGQVAIAHDNVNQRVRVNGGSAVTGASGATADLTNTVRLGRGFTTNYWTADVGEVLMYDSMLSDADRAQVEDYLASKWGL